MKIRTAFYLDSSLIKLLKLRSLKTKQSMSDYLAQVVSERIQEEQADLKEIKKILKEPTISFENMLAYLKIKNAI